MSARLPTLEAAGREVAAGLPHSLTARPTAPAEHTPPPGRLLRIEFADVLLGCGRKTQAFVDTVTGQILHDFKPWWPKPSRVPRTVEVFYFENLKPYDIFARINRDVKAAQAEADRKAIRQPR